MVRKLTASRRVGCRIQDDVTREFHRLAKDRYPRIPEDIGSVVYRKPSGVINVRIIDPSFADVPLFDREDLLSEIMTKLPEGTLDDIGLLLLFTPAEAKKKYSYMMPAFDDPYGNDD